MSKSQKLSQHEIKSSLIKELEAYQSISKKESVAKHRVLEFLNQNDSFLGKANKKGHITSSAFVLNREKNKVLLTHHRKLGIWLQLGGHTEEGESVKISALREAQEESGVKEVDFVQESIFDIDVHYIPSRIKEEGHYHYDIRYLMTIDEIKNPIQISEESLDLRWIPLEEVHLFTQEESITRMLKKAIRAKQESCL